MTMLRAIPAPADALLGSSALAHVVTLSPAGRPQVSVVWCCVRGDRIVFCTESDTAKIRNLELDPRVVLSIEDEARNVTGTQQHLVIHGRARVVGPADPGVCDELCRVYVGTANHVTNMKRSATAVMVEVEIDRIGGNGPWVVG